jgi:teichuronic acid exporter
MSIERRAMSALKWAAAAKFVVQIVSWAGTLVVVRLLTPEDYGLMAKVAVVCTISGAIAELGLEAAIVRTAHLPREDLQKLYGVSLLFGAGVTALIAASAPLLAHLFHEPRLVWPIVAASFQIVIGALALVPHALYTRELSFRQIAKVEMVAGIATIAATLLLAIAGAGVWALVLGTLFGAIVRSTIFLVFGNRVSPLFSFRGIAEHIKVGLTLVGSRVSYFVLVQSDVLIGSAFLSTTQIGQYAVALQLATLPMSKVMGMINQITVPAVARQQDDRARVRQGVLKSISVIALVAFPTLWGISAVAPELVRVLFGDKWLESIPALAILPLIVPIRMICTVMFTTSFALGYRQVDLLNTVVNFILLPSGFYIGAHWGLIGLCSAWLVSVPLSYCVTLPAVLRNIGLRGRDLVAEIGAPAIAAGVMYAAVAALRFALHGQPPVAGLITLSLTGALVYLAVMALVSRRHLISGRNFMRAFLGRDAPKTV